MNNSVRAVIESGDMDYGGAWFRLVVRYRERLARILITPEALDVAHHTDNVRWTYDKISEPVKSKLEELYLARALERAHDSGVELEVKADEALELFGTP